MRYLLDTHAFLWMRHAPDRLGQEARHVCGAVASELSLSLASAWEMAIKLSLGKLQLREPLHAILADARATAAITTLAINETHILRVQHLPFYHRDPFDRLLIAQALTEGLVVLSADAAFDAYGVTRVW